MRGTDEVAYGYQQTLHELRERSLAPVGHGHHRIGTPGDSILLVHAHNLRGKYYGLVAGFVETGETLEECVRRELMEETGVRVENIRYFGSQPWLILAD